MMFRPVKSGSESDNVGQIADRSSRTGNKPLTSPPDRLRSNRSEAPPEISHTHRDGTEDYLGLFSDDKFVSRKTGDSLKISHFDMLSL
jgi:hypothetical protein